MKLTTTERPTLAELGVTAEQACRVTGMGLRRVEGCGPVDTIARKYAVGALSQYGIMAELYGTDSPQHHAGTARLVRAVRGDQPVYWDAAAERSYLVPVAELEEMACPCCWADFYRGNANHYGAWLTHDHRIPPHVHGSRLYPSDHDCAELVPYPVTVINLERHPGA